MARRWCVAAGAVVMVVVGVMGLLTETQAKEEPTIRSFWPPPMDNKTDMRNRFKNPAEKAVQGLDQLLLGKKDTRAGTDSVFGMYLPSLNPLVVKNLDCISDVLAIIRIWTSAKMMGETLGKGKLWPFTLPDSWGKVPDGILFGNVMPWGMQEECTMINASEHFLLPEYVPPLHTEFRGRYCLVSLRNIDPSDRNGLVDVWRDSPLMKPEVRVGVAMTMKEVPPIFSYGTCMPSSCTADDLRASIDSILKPVGKMANNIDCHLEDEHINFNAGDITFIVILSVLGAIVLSAAIVDLSINYFNKHELRQGPLKVLLVFSAYSNMRAIFAIKLKEHPDVITCLHGIRVFTMAWVVWAHSFIMQAQVTQNLMYNKEMTDGVLDQIVANGTFSVDTFFFMSGLLVAYGVLMEREKSRRVNWILYYVHRFVRLAPPIMFTAASVATVFRFALVGPYAGHIERSLVEKCQKYWWSDSFFIGNFLHYSKTCLPQCWYTSVDFQLFALAPLVLAPLLTNNMFSLVWLFVLTLASVAVNMINIAVYDLIPSAILFGTGEHEPKAMVDLYTKPWARADAYLIGIWTGWLLMQVRGRKLKIHPVAVVLGWVVSAAIALAVLFGMTEYNVFNLIDPKKIPEEVSILYGGLSRLAWGVSLMWVVFACHTGYGGIVNSILSHPSLQPLSRLTFALFLISIPVQVIYTGAIYMPLYVNHLNKITETCGYLFIGGLIGIPLSLMMEGPLIGLEKLLIPRPSRITTEAQQEKKEE